MATEIAQPLKYTLLSLPYYAQIMGISPVHFQGAHAGAVFPVIPPACNDLWPRYSWQSSDRVSHEDLARSVYDAEQDIARVLGYWPAPKWAAQEIHKYPRHHRRDVYRFGGRNVRGQDCSINAKWGKIIAPGRRATTLVGIATVAAGTLVYSDEDLDGFYETATIQLPTTFTDVCELKVYHHGTNAHMAWEIRPYRSKSISAGTVTFVFDSWLFIDPDLQSAYPTTAGFGAIDISTTDNYVTSVDVYREYNNITEISAVLLWEPTPSARLVCTLCGGAGCAACALTEQNGCLHVRDPENGIIVPQAATYDSDDEEWDGECFTVCRDPDLVQLWYYSGDYDEYYLTGQSCEPLSNYLAHPIAWMATARLERPFCSCANVTALAQHLREDLARVGEVSNTLTMEELSNPFGTRRGEIMAWRRIGQQAEKVLGGFAI